MKRTALDPDVPAYVRRDLLAIADGLQWIADRLRAISASTASPSEFEYERALLASLAASLIALQEGLRRCWNLV